MDKEHLKKLMAFTCDIPQYNETQKRLQNWLAKNAKEAKKCQK